MTITITPEIEEFVSERVRSGAYASATEVILVSLRLGVDHRFGHQVQLDKKCKTKKWPLLFFCLTSFCPAGFNGRNDDQCLRLLEAQEQKLAQLKRDIRAGVDDIQQGRYKTYTTEAELESLAAEITGRGEERLKQMRSFAVRDYLIFYQPIEDGIEVIRVLHSSRDIESEFEQFFDSL
jgi:toxin ParE1/3/4